MEQEILKELIAIKYLLVGLLLTTGIPMVVIVLSRIVGVRFRDRTKGETFRVVCAQFLEDGEYTKLIEYCRKELIKRPNSAISYWYIGRSYFEQQKFSEAKEAFRKAIDIDPSWDKEYIAPFMESMNEKH